MKSIHAVAIVMASLVAAAACAQDDRQLAELPIVVVRNDGLTARTLMDYVKELSTEFNVGGFIVDMMDSPEVRESLTAHPNPASGMLVYMVQGFVPGAEQITFSEVTDEAEFERIVRAKAPPSNPMAHIEGGDGKFKVELNYSSLQPLEEALERHDDDGTAAAGEPEEDEEKSEVRVTFAVGGGSSQGISLRSERLDEEIIEKDGQQFVEQSFSTTEYYRYHDGFMFQSTYADLFDTPLPSRETLLGKIDAAVDAEIQFYPDRIPMGFKHLFLNTVAASAGTSLQQFDEEDDVDYAVRRSSGDLGVAALKAIVLDTQKVGGHLLLAHDEVPVRGQLTLETRRNSQFAGQLAKLSSARSRFAPILNDDAAATLHTCIKLPDESRELLLASGNWIRGKLSDVAGFDVDLAVAGEEFRSTVEGIAKHGNLEVLIKLGWSASTDGVLYGGIQVDDNPHLLEGLASLLSNEIVDPDQAISVGLVQHGDHQFLEIAVPVSDNASIPFRISRVYLTHANACLWFAAGNEQAHEILTQSIAACGEATRLTRTPLMSGSINVDKWLAYPQDDPVGIAGLPTWYDHTVSQLYRQAIQSSLAEAQPEDSVRATAGTSPPPLAQAVAESSDNHRSADSYLQRARDSGGTFDARFTIDANEAGMTINTEIGAVIGRYLIVQYLAAIEVSMGDIQPGSPTDGDADTQEQEPVNR